MTISVHDETRPVVLVGCGRLGSAIVEGWLHTGALDAKDLIILTPSSKPVAEAAKAAGARVNPPLEALSEARAVVFAVKPAKWRDASADLLEAFAPDAVIVSVMAGVRAQDISEAYLGRSVARVMPTTAVATGQGVAGLWSANRVARDVAHQLFDGLADTVDLDREDLIDVATAVAGSGPAYVHAFTRALAEAGVAQGLDADSALRLARGAVRSAASADPASSLADLIARVASPGGTTEAGLKALADGRALDAAVEAAVAAGLNRARELAGH
ncbi:MAG: pyrroline-5-carboxylate reductase [Brevundimonas sp.]|nr:pyrroline-5-carboxylate reductase [Brevundimonas sp.]